MAYQRDQGRHIDGGTNNLPVIERYFSSDDKLLRVGRDFRNLIKIVRESHGEFSMQLRDDYFNVYYRGNSLAKITVLSRRGYTVEISSAFLKGSVEELLGAWESTNVRGRRKWSVDNGQARSFLTKTNMTKLGKRIAKVNYREELVFEQILMTDNPPSKRLVIIDRQVEDHESAKKLDMLALVRPDEEGAFRFLVIEVKLGNSPELRDHVAGQLNGYVDHIRKHIGDYVACYTRNYAQKYELGLMDFDGAESSIDIDPVVESMVVVGGYSGIAVDAIKELKSNNPKLRVLKMRNSLV